MSENTIILVLLLPLIFILHNVEEYISFDQFKDIYLKVIGRDFFDRNIFLFAISFLSISVSSIIIANYFISNHYLQLVTVIIVFSIFINGIQHCIGSLICRKILPGMLTAVFLIIPFSIIFILKLKYEILFGIKDFIVYMIVSAVVTYVAIFVSLFFGYFLNKLIKFKGDDKNG